MTPIEKITKARINLILSQPFFGSLIMRLPMIEDRRCIDPTSGKPSMCTNGVRIRYHPDFVDQLPIAQLIGVLAHEIMHCALGHCTRRGQRDPTEWNIACDLAENPLILEAGLELPEGALIDRQFAGMSADDIYARRQAMKPPPQEPEENDDDNEKDDENDGEPDDNNESSDDGDEDDGDEDADDNNEDADGDEDQSGGGDDEGDGEPSNDPGGCGGVEDAPGEDGETIANEAERAALENEWRVATLQAAQTAKMAGQLADCLKRFADEIRVPALDWREMLRRFWTLSSQDDHTWSRPNRRFVASNLYLPSRYSEALGEIVIAVDTSGSIDDVTLAQFQNEINVLIEDSPPSTVHIVYCDENVARVDAFTAEEYPIKLDPASTSGGTDFRPVFDWIETQAIEPVCVIYLTDLYGTFPAKPPLYPMLWAATSPAKAPFGETVRLPAIVPKAA